MAFLEGGGFIGGRFVFYLIFFVLFWKMIIFQDGAIYGRCGPSWVPQWVLLVRFWNIYLMAGTFFLYFIISYSFPAGGHDDEITCDVWRYGGVATRVKNWQRCKLAIWDWIVDY